MQINKISFPEDIYSAHLETVNNIKFTRREVDIIAYLFSGRSAKTISSFLSIAPKTLESHMRNVMAKLDCNSRDGIIDFIEKSDKFSFVKKYYLSLIVQSFFEKQLLTIANQLAGKSIECLLVHWDEEDYNPLSLRCLEKHLGQAGVKLLKESYTGNSWPQGPLGGEKEEKDLQVLYLLPQKLLEGEDSPGESTQEPTLSFLKKLSARPNYILAFFLPPEMESCAYDKIQSSRTINFFRYENYYLFVFELLQQLLPETNFEEKIQELKDFCRSIYEPSQVESSLPEKPEIALDSPLLGNNLKVHGSLLLQKALYKKKVLFLGTLACFFILLVMFLVNGGRETLFQSKSLPSEVSIRSDLLVPTDSIFLNRPGLLQQIEESFKNNLEIQTTALIGIGGAGKTTLARHYARQQAANLVWELNAETQESLKDSFESLADALSNTEEERKKLRTLKDIKIVTEREQKIISFVREKLKKLSNWFLIYDNVGKVADIQQYFPHDFRAWGKGRILIVTRDKNIESNNFVNKAVQVGEFTSKEKLELFTKIMENGNSPSFLPAQIQETETFLHDLPPFPLDISIAAYYLKATHIPYGKYLEHLKEQHKEFAVIQENVLKDASPYTKTRYNIITLSLQQLVGEHKEFVDLLLLISLLDFRSIPLDLLNKFKNEILVENFIYNLKKYSLVTYQLSSPAALPTLSMHQSTQEISLEYLKRLLTLTPHDKLLQNVFNIFESYIEEVINAEDLSRIKLLLKHCEALLRHQDLLNSTVKGAVEAKLGYIYYYLNDYNKAKEFLEGSLKDFREKGSASQEKVAQTLMYLGDVYSELCNHQKAKSLCEESLELYKKHFSQNELGIARALAYLGNVYRRLGDYTKAKDLCEQSLEIYQKDFSKNPLRVSWVLAHLGITHKELGDYEKARTFLEKSLKTYEETLSKNHARVAWVCGHLGDVYRELGDYPRAKTHLTQSLAIYTSNFSENHLRAAWVNSLLGSLYRDMGKYEEAKHCFSKSLTVYEKNYGQNHTEIGLLLERLGQTYLLAGDLTTSEDLLQRALKILQHNNHPKCYSPLEVLAEIYLRKYKEASVKGEIQAAQQLKKQALSYLTQAQKVIEIHFPLKFLSSKKIQLKLKELNE